MAKEANPAVFTQVTFPFLFGVMFGDVMHGIMLFTFASYVCLFADRLKDSSLALFCHIRYLLLLMGFFATYCGFMYNDMTSIPLTIFGPSCYDLTGETAVLKQDCVYPIGIDPSWYLGLNELTFTNSLKMKIAVIYGVVQMLMGICHKGLNAIYFKEPIDFIFEFIP